MTFKKAKVILTFQMDSERNSLPADPKPCDTRVSTISEVVDFPAHHAVANQLSTITIPLVPIL